MQRSAQRADTTHFFRKDYNWEKVIGRSVWVPGGCSSSKMSTILTFLSAEGLKKNKLPGKHIIVL